MELLLALGAASTVALLVLGFTGVRADPAAERRIATLRSAADAGSRADVEHLDRSLLDQCGSRLMQWVPARLTQPITTLAARAGMTVAVPRFLLAWLGMVFAAMLCDATWLLLQRITVTSLVGSAALAVVALYGPLAFLRRRAALRARAIARLLPQALDIIVTNIECGVGLQAAMLVVAQKFAGPLATEFARAMREIAVGVPRDDALAAMATRAGSSELASIARAIAQAERSGVSVGDILRARAREIREQRRLSAREQANKIPVKMTIPMALFLFPTLFLLLLGPVVLSVIDMMGRSA